MKEINRIHLAKIPYEIEIEAKDELNKYFNALKKNIEDETILDDIEIRITEILRDQGVVASGIITVQDIEKVKSQLGSPEVFMDDQAESIDEEKSDVDNNISESAPVKRKLFRDRSNAVLGGVASGLSLYFDIDVVLIRVVMMALVFVTVGFMIPAYLLLWIVVPKAKSATDILHLKGQKISARALKEINQEYDFARINQQNKIVLNTLRVGLIVITSLMAFGGLMALIVGNMAILNQFETASISVPDYRNGIMGLPHILINIAGISFVAFSAILAVMSATFNAKKSQLIALGMLVFVGISSFTGGIMMFSMNENFTRQAIDQSMKKQSVQIDSGKLANIKSLQIDYNLAVEYVVSDEMHAEQYRYDYADNKVYPDFEFNGDKLVVKAGGHNENTNLPYFMTRYEKIVIYGPKLEMIEESATSSSRQNQYGYESVQVSYNTDQDQAKLTVKLNEDSNFEIVGRQKIDNLNLELGNLSKFRAPNTSANTLKVTGLRSTEVQVWSANQIALNGPFRCADNFGNRNGFELKYSNSPSITLNDKEIKAEQLICSEEEF